MSTELFERLQSWEGVPSGFASARDGIDAVLRDRGLRRTAPEHTVESLLRGAIASAILEGSGSSPEEVRDGGGDEVARSSARVSTQLLSMAPTLFSAPLQVFARLHALAAGSDGGAGVGQPRDAESAARLRLVAGLLTQRGDAPALLLAAVVHAELATTAPFPSHNGIVARAVERLVLVASGVDEKSLVVPEAAHLALRPAYESNLRGYRDGGVAGQHSWLLYAGEAYAAAAEASPLVRAAGSTS